MGSRPCRGTPRRKRRSCRCTSRRSAGTTASTTPTQASRSSSSMASRSDGSTSPAGPTRSASSTSPCYLPTATAAWGRRRARASGRGRRQSEAASHPRRALQSRAAALRAPRVPADCRSRGLSVHGMARGHQLPTSNSQRNLVRDPSSDSHLSKSETGEGESGRSDFIQTIGLRQRRRLL
jgi:hypothetical protein